MAYRKQPRRTQSRIPYHGPDVDQGTRNAILDMLSRGDARVQEYGRGFYNNIADGLIPDSRPRVQQAIRDFGGMMHKSDHMYANTVQGQAELAAVRALQAGGVTAAGAGLVNLTHQLANAFGGPADEPSQGALYL